MINAKKFRKQWVVLPDFQYHFMNRLFAIFVLVICLFGTQALWYFYEIQQIGVAAGLEEGHIYYQFINSVILKYTLSFTITIILCSLVFYAFGLYMSNKIAGPIFSLNLSLKKRLEGKDLDPTPIKIRSDDYFQDLAQNIRLNLEKNSDS